MVPNRMPDGEIHEHDIKVDLLRKIDIFSRLREYELDIIAKYSRFINVGKGKPIFSQGSASNRMYIIRSGRVGIIKNDNDENIDLACIIKGESFGELDLLSGSNRSAAAFAEEDSMLLAFPGENMSLQEVLDRHPYISAMMLYKFLSIISGRIYQVRKMVNEKTRWLQDLRKQLLSDKLTGLFNETFIKEELSGLLPSCGEVSSLLIIKPDNFKEINDKFGHAAGDSVLMLMSIFLQSVLGENDIAARFRGDEFAAVLADKGGKEAVETARELMKTYHDMDLGAILKKTGFRITVSIGIAVYPLHADNSDDLAKLSYDRMLEGRLSGGNAIISS
jgi:diguanylate cyclase